MHLESLDSDIAVEKTHNPFESQKFEPEIKEKPLELKVLDVPNQETPEEDRKLLKSFLTDKRQDIEEL